MRLFKGYVLSLLMLPGLALAETIGEVSTVFKWVGPNDKIVVEAFDDPKVSGVTCYLSRAKTGGVKGGLGLAEDRAEASMPAARSVPLHSKARSKTARRCSRSALRWCSRLCRWCVSSTASATPWCIWSTATG